MKKVLVVIISSCCFLLLIYLAVPYLIDYGLQNKSKNQNQNIETRNIIKQFNELDEKFEELVVKDFLNKDNLYENYSHNYTIKIPQSFKENKGIGKYSSTQFYNEDLGFVVAINVGKSNFKENIKRLQNNEIIKKWSKELENDDELKKIFEEALVERGFNEIELDNNKVTNYNNRMFLEMNFNANRVSNNNEYPVLIRNYLTLHKNLLYYFSFVTYQKQSNEIWNIEIQKSMSNVIISEYIKEKN